ncbi:MAG: hypothetical protein ACYDAQ_00085 [Mycobacteriales bacterium]
MPSGCSPGPDQHAAGRVAEPHCWPVAVHSHLIARRIRVDGENPGREDREVRIDGWNWVPRGYGLAWDLSRAPWWLRLWFATPFIDRFAYPVVIRRGYAWLVPHPGWSDDRDEIPAGWVVRSEDPEAHALCAGRTRTWTSRSRLFRRLRLPRALTLPGGRRVERQAHLFWRIRVPLWVALAGSGAVLLGWGGLMLGFATALLVEAAFSYRPPRPGLARPQVEPDGQR